jgi:hypothetical protein
MYWTMRSVHGVGTALGNHVDARVSAVDGRAQTLVA